MNKTQNPTGFGLNITSSEKSSLIIGSCNTEDKFPLSGQGFELLFSQNNNKKIMSSGWTLGQSTELKFVQNILVYYKTKLLNLDIIYSDLETRIEQNL